MQSTSNSSLKDSQSSMFVSRKVANKEMHIDIPQTSSRREIPKKKLNLPKVKNKNNDNKDVSVKTVIKPGNRKSLVEKVKTKQKTCNSPKKKLNLPKFKNKNNVNKDGSIKMINPGNKKSQVEKVKTKQKTLGVRFKDNLPVKTLRHDINETHPMIILEIIASPKVSAKSKSLTAHSHHTHEKGVAGETSEIPSRPETYYFVKSTKDGDSLSIISNQELLSSKSANKTNIAPKNQSDGNGDGIRSNINGTESADSIYDNYTTRNIFNEYKKICDRANPDGAICSSTQISENKINIPPNQLSYTFQNKLETTKDTRKNSRKLFSEPMNEAASCNRRIPLLEFGNCPNSLTRLIENRKKNNSTVNLEFGKNQNSKITIPDQDIFENEEELYENRLGEFRNDANLSSSESTNKYSNIKDLVTNDVIKKSSNVIRNTSNILINNPSPKVSQVQTLTYQRKHFQEGYLASNSIEDSKTKKISNSNINKQHHDIYEPKPCISRHALQDIADINQNFSASVFQEACENVCAENANTNLQSAENRDEQDNQSNVNNQSPDSPFNMEILLENRNRRDKWKIRQKFDCNGELRKPPQKLNIPIPLVREMMQTPYYKPKSRLYSSPYSKDYTSSGGCQSYKDYLLKKDLYEQQKLKHVPRVDPCQKEPHPTPTFSRMNVDFLEAYMYEISIFYSNQTNFDSYFKEQEMERKEEK